MCPRHRLAVDVLLEDLFVEKEAECLPRPPPRHVGVLDDDVLERVQAARILGIAVRGPLPRRLTAVRVVNGKTLPESGLTVVTALPMYVKGHFNAPDTTAGKRCPSS